MIVSSAKIKDYYLRGGKEMERDVFLASKYLDVLTAEASNDLEWAYQKWLTEKSPVLRLQSGHGYVLLPQMTSEEDQEWLNWYYKK